MRLKAIGCTRLAATRGPTAVAILAILPILIAGCGGPSVPGSGPQKGGGQDAGASMAALTTCERDTRADAFQVGLSKTAPDLTVRVVGGTPAPPQKGSNELEVQLLDGSGSPIDGAAIRATPFMPDHGHGTAVKAATKPMGGGVYVISPLYLFMAGLWQITLDVTRPGATAPSSVVFNFCIDG